MINYIEQFENLIAKDELEIAVRELLIDLNIYRQTSLNNKVNISNISKDIIALSARLSNLNKPQNIVTISYENRKAERISITYLLLNLLEELDNYSDFVVFSGRKI
jgi:hypothetical protein